MNSFFTVSWPSLIPLCQWVEPNQLSTHLTPRLQTSRWVPCVEGLYRFTNPMSGVFRNMPPPPPPRPARVCPPPLVRGEDTLAGWRGGGGSIVRKTPDTALYSIYVSILWFLVIGDFPLKLAVPQENKTGIRIRHFLYFLSDRSKICWQQENGSFIEQ